MVADSHLTRNPDRPPRRSPVPNPEDDRIMRTRPDMVVGGIAPGGGYQSVPQSELALGKAELPTTPNVLPHIPATSGPVDGIEAELRRLRLSNDRIVDAIKELTDVVRSLREVDSHMKVLRTVSLQQPREIFNILEKASQKSS